MSWFTLRKLKSNNPSVRQKAIEKIGKSADKKFLQPLITTLKDKDQSVRLSTAQVLVNFGTEAMPLLMGMLEDNDQEVRMAATKSLCKIGNKQAMPAILKVHEVEKLFRDRDYLDLLKKILNGDTELLIKMLDNELPDVRRRSAFLLGEFGITAAVLPLIAVLKKENRSVKLAAVEALGKLKGPQTIAGLVEALELNDWKVLEAVIRSLLSLGWKPVNDTHKCLWAIVFGGWTEECLRTRAAVRPLILALQNENPNVTMKMKAAETIGKIGDPSAVNALINSLEYYDTENVRYELSQEDWKLPGNLKRTFYTALAQIGDERAINYLIQVLTAEKYDSVGQRIDHLDDFAMEALKNIGDGAIQPLIESLLKENHLYPLRYLATTLFGIGGRHNLERLIDLINDPDVGTSARIALLDSLLKSGEILSTRTIETLLIAILHNRGSAKALLDRAVPDWRKTAEAKNTVPWFLKGLDEENFRAAAIYLLGQIGDPRGFAPLLKLTNDPKNAEKLINALENILVKSAKYLSDHDLKTASSLKNITGHRYHSQSIIEGSYDSAWVEVENIEIDSTHIRQLASEELKSRGHV